MKEIKDNNKQANYIEQIKIKKFIEIKCLRIRFASISILQKKLLIFF
jgi:hypothetical protein